MVKTTTNYVIRILPEDIIHEYEDVIMQIEPINYVYYNGLKQFSKTMFICEIKRS